MSKKILLASLDLGKSFEKMLLDSFFYHRGCMVERTPNGYIIFGKHCVSMKEVDAVIAGLDRSKKS